MSDNVFLFSSPLQYFFARVIASRFPNQQTLGLQSVDLGDFSHTFRSIDNVMEWDPIKIQKIDQDTALSLGSIDRLFMSNRFNRYEINIWQDLRGCFDKLCYFEDGLAIYSNHAVHNHRLHDGNLGLRSQHLSKEVVKLLLGRKKRISPRFLTARHFDEVYSVYPDIPWLPHSGASWFSISEDIRRSTRAGSEEAAGCVLLAQPLMSEGHLSRADYENFLLRVIRYLESCYETVYLKPHPRDDAAVIEVAFAATGARPMPEVFRQIPIEIFSARNPGVPLYGFGSSALCYAASAFEARSISLIDAVSEAGFMTPSLQGMWSHLPALFDKYNVERISKL